jgi:hypothetical protein
MGLELDQLARSDRDQVLSSPASCEDAPAIGRRIRLGCRRGPAQRPIGLLTRRAEADSRGFVAANCAVCVSRFLEVCLPATRIV